MDRPIVYPGQIPLETDLLSTNRNAMLALAKLAACLFGAATFANGLAAVPDSPASMRVSVSAGEIYQLANLDGSAYSSLAADTTHQVVKQGINLDATLLTLAAPGTAGQSTNYLIQATLLEADTGAVTLPYYNASNPAVAYSGPANTGAAQATVRSCKVTLQAKAGTAATTGTQTTPAPDAGYIGLWVVTVANGQTTITAGNISQAPGAPVVPSQGLVVGGLQGNACTTSAAGGSADALTGNYLPQVTALANGMSVFVRATQANATGAPTFQAGTTAAKAIVKGAGAALVPGDIAGAGHWVHLKYDSTADKWVLLNPATGISQAQQAGEICHFARSTAPTGFLKANGAAVSRTTYAALFSAIGTTFGAGDGSTTFTLPDLRGEFLRSWDDGRGIDASRALGSAQADLIKNHQHYYYASTTSNGSYGGPDGERADGFQETAYTSGDPITGGGAETRPRNVAMLACIKY